MNHRNSTYEIVVTTCYRDTEQWQAC